MDGSLLLWQSLILLQDLQNHSLLTATCHEWRWRMLVRTAWLATVPTRHDWKVIGICAPWNSISSWPYWTGPSNAIDDAPTVYRQMCFYKPSRHHDLILWNIKMVEMGTPFETNATVPTLHCYTGFEPMTTNGGRILYCPGFDSRMRIDNAQWQMSTSDILSSDFEPSIMWC
jgi:hypothetical protein